MHAKSLPINLPNNVSIASQVDDNVKIVLENNDGDKV